MELSYYEVNMVNGALDIDYINLREGIVASATKAFVALADDPEPRPGWRNITREEFEQHRPEVVEPEPEETQMSLDEARDILDDARRLEIELPEEVEMEAKSVIAEALPIPDPDRDAILGQLENRRK